MPKRLGIPADSYLHPLTDAVRRGAREWDLDVIEASPAERALQLRQGELDGAFLSPVDYARDYSDYVIAPDVACSSFGPSGLVLLAVNQGRRGLKTIAVDPRYTTEIVLAHIVLVEKYDVTPTIVPSGGSVNHLLASHDAVLIPAAHDLQPGDGISRIDLVDEWTDLTGLPFVHGFWALLDDAFTPPERAFLSSIRPAPVFRSVETADDEEGQPPIIDFTFGPEIVNALNEFYRMAYYHGILTDIPDLRFPDTIAREE